MVAVSIGGEGKHAVLTRIAAVSIGVEGEHTVLSRVAVVLIGGRGVHTVLSRVAAVSIGGGGRGRREGDHDGEARGGHGVPTRSAGRYSEPAG
ncbi:unnamed protein product [Angiostrongylus costaricensis]|uniref:Uncharacterized protein n=1 Tax=Angiostrongylus costaricensis TaxID=334426 RepID=A0A0R3PL89_ANGCS|nr:unnamed protein product [Angiostrongylus costaricensis]